MTLLITGATGLVGKTLIYYLLKETEYKNSPKAIRILVRKKNYSPDRQVFIEWCINIGIDVFFGDLNCNESVYAFTCVKDPEKTTLIHSGAIFNFWQPYKLLYDVNVLGTERILNGFHQNNLHKLIFISSAAVYGNLSGSSSQGITENQPLDLTMKPTYELTKALAEDRIWQYFHANPNRNITVLRPSGIIGGSGTTIDLFARMIFKSYIPLPRGGKDKLSLVDVKDVAHAIYLCILNEKSNGEVFNLVSFTPTVRDFVIELSKTLNRKIYIVTVPLFFFKPMFYLTRIIRRVKHAKEQSLLLPVLFDKLGQDIWIDDHKLKMIGFESKINLEESMQQLNEFLENNPWYSKQKFKSVI
ncbi:NAD-dependent epimerase/dehydratase family protein [Candidatus Hodarchaeum mangrovi]